MEIELAQKAVAAAINGNWKDALKINLQILIQNPKDVDSLNRLARAYIELGNTKKAKESAQKAIKLDPFNKIATASLEKWKKLKRKPVSSANHFSPDAFLEEPGKTRLVDLLHPGPTEVLAELDCGDVVNLAPFAHRVNITTPDGKYIGRLPDDLSARLRTLIKMGNEYSVLIKSVEKNSIKIFIREILKSKEGGDAASFPAEKLDYVSFTPPELVHKKEEVVEALHQEES